MLELALPMASCRGDLVKGQGMSQTNVFHFYLDLRISCLSIVLLTQDRVSNLLAENRLFESSLEFE